MNGCLTCTVDALVKRGNARAKGRGKTMRWPWKREWVKSSLSVYNGNCVELSGLDGNGPVLMRDSKNPRGGSVKFPRDVWDKYMSEIKAAAGDDATVTAAHEAGIEVLMGHYVPDGAATT
jgi:hypothetical protein